ncbi:acyclic terpene utilization AtuA family protein [Alkalicoccobacillus porphyridii]|uniref:DUF1446 domain-containing protein n=1 Tax=Alkalicoccobacillus porphyridii TaxID=2597270 RepID=A0A553ZYL5_9BACI|nr:acyclic terpene utilization AtuA family protein [Alkalicoccobacillus porphyridii]TSB46532.1 DUF1446 domain-containing protein [Alkalicoccobacillus porphyridii]
MNSIRIGTGAGYAGDRIDAAVQLVKKGKLDYLILEGLAERTTAIAQLQKNRDPKKGYGQFLEERMKALLPVCRENGVTIITNLGAANPEAAAHVTYDVAVELGLNNLHIAYLTGADVMTSVQHLDLKLWETGERLNQLGSKLVSADAYLGAQEILPAFQSQPHVIITGRVADPSLFLAPMIFEFGWALDDWTRLGAGTVLAHLLECGAQVTGGYFADGASKEVPDLKNVGLPFVDVYEDGSGVIGKTPNSGGSVSVQTCKEQLLYEVMDPAAYLTPDVTADFSKVAFTQVETNVVAVNGASGYLKPKTFKATIGIDQGFIGEGMIIYGGHHAIERAKLAIAIVKERLIDQGFNANEMKEELIGLNALHGQDQTMSHSPYEVMVRVAARANLETLAKKVGEEIENLWLNGPGGPGGVRVNTKQVISAYSTLIPREFVKAKLSYLEVK